MRPILCRLGLHSWSFGERWTPSIDARIVTRFDWRATCRRCGKIDRVVMRFDPETGAPLDGGPPDG